MEEDKKEETISVKEPEIKQEVTKPIKEKIKIWKFNMIASKITLVIVVVSVILCLIQFANASFSNYMWININNKISDINYSVMQNFPFLASYGFIILIISCLVLVIAGLIVVLVKRNDLKIKTIVINALIPVLLITALNIDYLSYFTFSNASHKGINEIYMRDYLSTEFKEEDLENVVDYFKNRIFTYAESLDRKNGEIVVSDSYNMVVEDLSNLSVKYEFLKGSYPTKIRSLNDFDLVSSGYPAGLTYNFTVGLDDTYVKSLNKIFVLTHEFCHVKGIYRESDADYCTFLSGYNSNNDVSKYSMYVGLMPNILGLLRNKELYYSILDEFGSVCLDSRYNEICNLYSKDTSRYIESSDKLVFATYSLEVYKDVKEELKQYLLGITNRFDTKIYNEEDKVLSLEEANKLIDEESSSRLTLEANVNEDIYNKNMNYLKVLSDYFSNLYLDDSTITTPDYSSFNYLKPYPTGMFSALTESAPEFDYDRSIRSILEYFNKYVFN